MSEHRERELGAYFDGVIGAGMMADFDPAERPAVDRLLDRIALAPGQRVLEPGCGGGRLTELLATRVGPDGSVLGLDLSVAMVARAARRGLPRWAQVVRATARRVPLADQSVDVAVCFAVLPHLEQRPAALAELARVVRPGGRLWVAHLACRVELNRFHAGLEGPVRQHMLPATSELAADLDRAGFDTVEETDDGVEGYRVEAVRRPPEAPGGA